MVMTVNDFVPLWCAPGRGHAACVSSLRCNFGQMLNGALFTTKERWQTPGAWQVLLLQPLFGSVAGVILASSLMVTSRLLVRRAGMLYLFSSCLVCLLNLSSMNGMLNVKLAASFEGFCFRCGCGWGQFFR